MHIYTQYRSSFLSQVFQVTQAPSCSLVRLEEVPRDLDWKFLDNLPPIDQSRRHHVFLKQVSCTIYSGDAQNSEHLIIA